jgi:hypothetical protein
MTRALECRQSPRSVRPRLSHPLVFALVAGACQSHPLVAPEPRPQVESRLSFESHPALDLVFLIDDSASMKEEQELLGKNFPRFMRALEQLPEGLPDLRIAVVSSDFGAGSSGFCTPLGRRGIFQVKEGCGLDPARARFLAVNGEGEGEGEGESRKNFDGELAEVFSCLAQIGTDGCGYEHQLQALRAALSNLTIENRDFLRPEAYLGIILLTDEDDCSAEPDATLFEEIYPDQSPNLRCATLGHVCEGREVPATPYGAPLASCQPYQRLDDAEGKRNRLINVSDFVSFIKALKPGRPDLILVSGVIGWNDAPDARYEIGPGTNGLDLLPACRYGQGSTIQSAAPAVRIKHFIEAFGANTVHSICQEDLSGVMERIGDEFADKIRNRCLTDVPVDVDPRQDGLQADCQVTEGRPQAPGLGLAPVPLPSCSQGTPPCWALEPDSECPGRFRMEIRRPAGLRPPPGTRHAVQCLTCPATADGKPAPGCA